jgi:hypothetical protein
VQLCNDINQDAICSDWYGGVEREIRKETTSTMPFHVHRCKVNDRTIHDHAHLQTLSAAAASAQSFAETMDDNEFVVMAKLAWSNFKHFPREVGEMPYWPHAPETQWHYDFPPDVRAALPIVDMMIFATQLIRRFDVEEIDTLRELVEERAETHPGSSKAMLALIDAALAERDNTKK